MAYLPPKLQGGSALVAIGLAEDRFHVTNFMGDGEYPAHRAEKDEAERYVAWVVAALAHGEANALAGELKPYLRAMFPPDELRAGETNPALAARQIGFAALQRAVDDALYELEERSFDAPRPEDLAFVRCPSLQDRLTRDGLVRLRASDVADEGLRAEGVFVVGGCAIYPHPMLAPARELVVELLDLAAAAELEVAIAIHPYRVADVDEVPMRLLEDYWYGVKLTAENRDSLDRHDVGVRTFHAARQDTVERFFFPLLGTWFDWERRSRNDAGDPVKRLYVREVRPAADRQGEPLVAALNRELHAERDTAARRFTHVDGKMCWYDAVDYAPTPSRPDAPLGTPRLSRKLWRVDGRIPDATCEQLVGLHFRQNELIAEHLGAVLSDRPT